MNSEEDLQQFTIGDDARVKSDLYCLSVASSTRADLSVGGIGNMMPPRIAGDDAYYPFKPVEGGLQTPEATSCQCGDLCTGFRFPQPSWIILGLNSIIMDVGLCK